MSGDLIYDIGAHDGSDTDYYLRMGYQVVAVEANPVLASAIRDRFDKAIRAGQLMVENVGVASERGMMQFWICDGKSEWSSFKRENAARRGYAHHSVDVECVTIQDLFKKHGVPWYMKVDIEGHDRVCVRNLYDINNSPEYISVESYGGLEAINDLGSAGYRYFKVVDQSSFCTLENPETIRSRLYWFCRRFRDRSFYDKSAFVSRAVGKFGGRWVADKFIERCRRDGRYRFNDGASGPLPFRLKGRWISRQEACDAMENLITSYKASGADPFGRWFDIHAKKK